MLRVSRRWSTTWWAEPIRNPSPSPAVQVWRDVPPPLWQIPHRGAADLTRLSRSHRFDAGVARWIGILSRAIGCRPGRGANLEVSRRAPSSTGMMTKQRPCWIWSVPRSVCRQSFRPGGSVLSCSQDCCAIPSSLRRTALTFLQSISAMWFQATAGPIKQVLTHRRPGRRRRRLEIIGIPLRESRCGSNLPLRGCREQTSANAARPAVTQFVFRLPSVLIISAI